MSAHEPGCRANVFVPSGAPQYSAMLERAAEFDADALDYRYSDAGIWVTLDWLMPNGKLGYAVRKAVHR